MRLYKIMIVKRPDLTTRADKTDNTVEQYPAGREQEWIDHCQAMWGEYRSFFLPSESKVYRSRSSARDKQQIVERWGGKATIFEAEVCDFVPVEIAVSIRARARRQARIDRMREQLAELEAQQDEEWA